MTVADFRPNAHGEHLTTALRRVSGSTDPDLEALAAPAVQLPGSAYATVTRAGASASEFHSLADVASRSPAPMAPRRRG